jgi:fibronectin-binding autotransporter adhesin
MNVVLNSDFDANGAGAISIGANGGTQNAINTNGGSITLGGGNINPALNPARAVSGFAVDTAVLVTDSVFTSGGGSISIRGQGLNGGAASRGVIIQLGSDINAGGGSVTIAGAGGTGGSDNNGVAIGGGAAQAVQTVGAGTVTVTGTGGNGGSGANDGVLLYDTRFSTVDGAISITGTGGTAGTTNHGMRFGYNTQIVSTGDANITLTGTGNNGGAGIAANSHTGNFGPGGTVRIGQGLTGTYTGDIFLNSLGGSGIALGGAPNVGLGVGLAAVGTTGAVTLNASGAGIITLSSGSTISGTAGVSLTAGDVALAGTVSSSGGNVTLTPSTNNVTIGVGSSATFALSDAEIDLITHGAGGAIVIGALSNTQGLSIGANETVTAGAKNLVFRNGGNINIADQGAGTTALQTTGNVTLETNAQITNSTNGGLLAASTLTTNAVSGITLNTDVVSLTATNTTSGGIAITEANGLDLAGVSIGAGAGDIVITTTNGSIMTSGAIANSGTGGITLTANGAGSTLGLSNAVTAASGTVNLTADGDISQTIGGVITAGTLTGTVTTGSALLNTANNLVTNLGPFTANGSFLLTNVQSLHVAGAVGATTVSLAANGANSDLSLAANVSTAGGTVTLTAGRAISQAAGTITTAQLSVTAANSSSLTEAGNNVGTVSANITGAGQSFSYTDVDSLNVGSVGSLNGVTTNNGALTLSAGAGGAGNLTFSQGINAGSSEARLIAANGAITQNAGGSITGGQLSVQARDSSSFAGAGNNAGTLSALVTGASQSFEYRDANSLTVGVTTTPPAGITAGNAIQTNNGNVTVTADAGTFTIAAAIAAGTGTVALTATTGAVIMNGGVTGGTVGITGTTVTQNAGSVITTSSGLTINTAGNDAISGVITGAGGFTQAGGGTTTINNTQTYTGATNVNAGTLLVNGSIAASVLTTVANGATLGGNGAVGAVLVQDGGTLAAGSSAGLLSTGSLQLEDGAFLVAEVGGALAGSEYDQIDVTGTVNLGGATLTASFINGFVAAAGDTFTIIDNDGTADAVVGIFAGFAEGAELFTFNNLSVRISYVGGDGNDVTLTISYVDTIVSSVDYTLPAGAKNLRLDGAAVNGTGNADANVITGNANDNVLRGLGGADTLQGLDGTDHLFGGTGGDTLEGGNGFDYARYDDAAAGVVAALFNVAINTGEAAGDTYDRIEGLVGSAHGDALFGNDGGNYIFGLGGDDALHGNGGSDNLFGGDGIDHLLGGGDGDVLDGGASFDYARYDFSGSGVTAVMTTPWHNAGEAAGDHYFNIEGLVGSSFGDVLAGDSGNNYIFGQGGADFLWGGRGGDGLYGGAGSDSFMLNQDVEIGVQDVIGDFAFGQDAIYLNSSMNGSTFYGYDGTNTTVSNGAGWSVFVANATIAQVEASLYYI